MNDYNYGITSKVYATILQTIFMNDNAKRHLDISKILECLQPEGIVSRTIKGFEVRDQQQKMLTDIINAYNHNQIALIEAGTGTGKTLAYLLPAIIWAAKNKERTVISTNTITLQEQLINKDIPALTKAIGVDIKAVLVKGMSNYLCLRKLADSQQEIPMLTIPEAKELENITAWSSSTKDGTKSSLSFLPTHASWERVNAESDTCSHIQCPHYQECFFFKARQQANDAQLLVVNHHMLFADLSARADDGNYDDASILPAYSRIILDEAHNIEDIATDYFASEVSRVGFSRILARLASESTNGKANGRIPLLKEKIIEHYKNQNTGAISSILSRLNIELPADRKEVYQHIGDTFQYFTLFVTEITDSPKGMGREDERENKLRLLKNHTKIQQWDQTILPSIKKTLGLTHRYIQSIRSLQKDIKYLEDEKLNEKLAGVMHDIQAFVNRLEDACVSLQEFISGDDWLSRVRWIESQKINSLTNIHLVNAELDIAPSLVDCLFSRFSTIVLCSATMTTNKSFEFIRERLGLLPKYLKNKVIKESVYDSPFNYLEQALLVIPTDITAPSHPKFHEDAAEKILRAIQASNGNAFVLFTSYSMLRICHQLLLKRLNDQRFHVFKQGDENRLSLLTKFKNTDRSILFGTDSFWEGVDIVGDALRCVIIVKLPFKVPSEPIIQARTEAIVAKGGDSFTEYSVPNAIVKFKQGFGRLIRNKNDRGCIVCLDSRLLTKEYGKLFLNSLPECQFVFDEMGGLEKKMTEFYRKTYYLAAKQL